ncbi:hypothetical protein Q8F55_000690 [Vanrija albida]|uniref:Cleavage and polyadenylation specificity factor subunit 2 n=1 Tax=Vanrija albida TaxID=181172 RepID=A0ABR3QDZ9_9TREE
MITLTPLSASASSASSSEPVSYFLELDNARILLDMGQRDFRASQESGNWEYENKIRELAPTLSLVLLSHSPASYLGLYAYARAHWGLKCPVYATQPTVEMGRVVALADAESWRSECPVPEAEVEEGVADAEQEDAGSSKVRKPLRGPFVPTKDEIHEAFDWIKATRYNQPLHLGGDISHLLLTPFPSGHVLGGTLFKIRSPTSGTVLYAVGMNHTKDLHLDGMVSGQGGLNDYAEDIGRPDLLIVEGDRTLVVSPKLKDRRAAILNQISYTLESGHSVLLPCDPSPRLLELLVLLDQHWAFKLNPASRKPGQPMVPWNFPLCVVSRTYQDMVSFARSLVEWMGTAVRENGGVDVVASKRGGKRNRRQVMNMGSEYGVLDFTHVKFFSSPAELREAFPGDRPKVVLAIPPTMSHGPSRSLFTEMGSKPGNLVLLTNRGEDQTLARDLFNRWESQQADASKWGHGGIGAIKSLSGPLALEMDSKVPLSGAELEAYEEEERLKKEREAAQKAALDRSHRMLEADDLESDSESEGEEDDAADGIVLTRTEGANAFAGDSEDIRTMSFDIFVKGQQMRTGRNTAAGEMARFRMFPFIAKGRNVDSYGEGLDIGQWVRKGREIEEEGETEEVREAKRRKLEDEEKALEVQEPPSKFVSEEVTIDLHASIEFVDMDGLMDGQATKTIIAKLQPRKLVVVKSDAKSTQALLDFFKSSASITDDVFHPGLNETLRIGEHVQSYSLQLGDSISALLSGKWSKFEGYDVAMVDGKLAYASGSTVPLLEAPFVQLAPAQPEVKAEEEVQEGAKVEVIEEVAEDAAEKPEGGEEDVPMAEAEVVEVKVEEPAPEPEPIAVSEAGSEIKAVAKPAGSRTAPLPSSLFIGDLRLVDLKRRLGEQSIPAEFAGEGVLVCGEGIGKSEGKKEGSGQIVAVRKLAEGQVVIEGAISKTYFSVRKELYASFAQVTL